MEPEARALLERRIYAAVRTMLTEGDRTYLQGLSRTALLKAVEAELRFLGLYSHDDHETPVVIHTMLEQHLDQWYAETVQRELPKAKEQPLPFGIPLYRVVSPLIQTSSSTGNGVLIDTECTYYFGFDLL